MQPAAPVSETPPSSCGPVRHIAVEATRLLRERRGIGRYVRNVLRWIPVFRPDVRFTLFVRSPREAGAMREHLRDVDPTLPDRTSVEAVALLPCTPADVVWYAWNGVEPPARREAVVVATIHDVASMLQLDHRWWKVVKRAKYRRRYSRAIRRADLVITISEFTSREIQRLLRADESKIRVILLGADDLPAPSDAGSAVLEKLGIDGPFFLAVGARDPRKNLATLHRAMEILNRRHSVPLVECGPRDPGAGLPFVRYAGYVDDAELATLYRRATALVFPSRYEGFGLPAAEAMWAGGRVACANATSLPEVVGEAGLLFPWNDAEVLAQQLGRLLDDAGLRERLTTEGRTRAVRFRWEETARKTLEAFDEAVATRRRAVSADDFS